MPNSENKPANHPRSSFNPEPRDFKQEFEQYLAQVTVSNAEYGALLATVRQIVFDREQLGLIEHAISLTGRRQNLSGRHVSNCPSLLRRLYKQDTQ